MKKDEKVFVQHILESIENIEEYTRGYSKERFLQSKLIRDAVIRNLEIIGEAAKQVPDAFREMYSDIPWSEMAGMRDKLIHKYFGVDMDLT